MLDIGSVTRYCRLQIIIIKQISSDNCHWHWLEFDIELQIALFSFVFCHPWPYWNRCFGEGKNISKTRELFWCGEAVTFNWQNSILRFLTDVLYKNNQKITSCRLPIRWTCLFRMGKWIGNRQLVSSLNLYCLFRIWIGNRQLVIGCRFVELILSVPNLIRWNFLYRISNWIGNRQLVALMIRWTYIARFESESATGS